MIGQSINAILVDLTLTPEEFADQIGVGKSTIYKIIRGDTKKITKNMAEKISNIFPQYSVHFLMSLNSQKSYPANEDYFKSLKNGDENYTKSTTITLDQDLINREQEFDMLAAYLLKIKNDVPDNSLLSMLFEKCRVEGENNFIRKLLASVKEMNEEKAAILKETVLSLKIATED
ncbi:MAG: helix-turn-helix transcriptional regulator [Bacteroidota bacterium]